MSNMLSRQWRHAIPLAVAVCIVVVQFIGTSRTRAQELSVSVDLGSNGPALVTRLSTNLSTPELLEQAGAASARLTAWAPTLVRLHAGADTDEPPLLPSGLHRGEWNFIPLDAMASTVRAYGGEPMINVRYPPTWMWTCRAPFSDGGGGVGTLRDPTFNEFADYVARLVGWYNAGGFVDEQGKFHASGRQSWAHVWELWNEPDESSENPCHPAGGGPALKPNEYVAMWNAVVPRMLAVDPTVQVVGPATADPRPDYLEALMAGAVHPPDALTYHAYAAYDNGTSDRAILDKLDRIILSPESPNWPALWITEFNLNSAADEDPAGRPWGPLGVAWAAGAYRRAALAGIGLINQFEFVAQPQFGLVDEQTGSPRLPYWRDVLISRAFPVGSTLLQGSSSTAGIDVLAARRPDGGTSVMIINSQAPGSSDRSGRGVPATVSVHLAGTSPVNGLLRLLDATAVSDREPLPVAVSPAADFQITFAGYGVAIVDLATMPAPAALNAS